MKVLVTGGAGFIGSQIVSQLLDRGDDVRILDLLLPEAWGSSRPTIDPRAEFVVGDARDATTVTRCLDGVNVVCHQAAMVGMGAAVSDLPSYASHNDFATAVVLAEAAAAGIGRIVLASSMVVYGEGGWSCPNDGPVRPLPRRLGDLEAGNFEPRCPRCSSLLDWSLVDESAALDPRSTYAATKLAQEHLASAWCRMTGGSVVALRYHNVYGPGMPRDTPYSGVAAMFRSSLERGDTPQVYEDGGQMRDFVHVTDIAAANLLAIDADTEGFIAANVCSGQPISIGEVAIRLADAFGGPAPVITGKFRLGDVRHVVASPKLAADALGFTATVAPAAGIVAFANDRLR